MKRTLVLLRHAKSDHPAGVRDLDRPLSDRGRADARAAGAWLARHAPELVLCSPSKRTRQTWQQVARGLPGKPDVRYDRRLYLGGVDELLELVRETDGSVERVLVIGHNPTLSQLAFTLDPQGGLDSDGLRTCGLSVHQLDGEWRDCDRGSCPIADTHTARA
jgi:phosphohistidine phosphatase